jgi:hypothetical protein
VRGGNGAAEPQGASQPHMPPGGQPPAGPGGQQRSATTH